MQRHGIPSFLATPSHFQSFHIPAVLARVVPRTGLACERELVAFLLVRVADGADRRHEREGDEEAHDVFTCVRTRALGNVRSEGPGPTAT